MKTIQSLNKYLSYTVFQHSVETGHTSLSKYYDYHKYVFISLSKNEFSKNFYKYMQCF
jgi:hypothetical protein